MFYVTKPNKQTIEEQYIS